MQSARHSVLYSTITAQCKQTVQYCTSCLFDDWGFSVVDPIDVKTHAFAPDARRCALSAEPPARPGGPHPRRAARRRPLARGRCPGGRRAGRRAAQAGSGWEAAAFSARDMPAGVAQVRAGERARGRASARGEGCARCAPVALSFCAGGGCGGKGGRRARCLRTTAGASRGPGPALLRLLSPHARTRTRTISPPSGPKAVGWDCGPPRRPRV